jgi:hypothetical protein
MIMFTAAIVRELRGSPLTVLVACLLLEQSGQVPITAQLLKDMTGYGDHTVTDSLRALESPTRQLLTRVAGGWRLTTGFQFPLEFQNRDIRGFGVSSSCSSFNRKSNKLLEEEEQETIEIRDIRDSDDLLGKSFRANYKKALELNIRDPKASQLSALPHVTPEFIQAHVDQAHDDGHPLGTAIYRIIHGWCVEVDETKIKAKIISQDVANETGHKPGCKCTDCSMARVGLPICPDCHHIYQNCDCEGDSSSSG